MSEQRNYSQKTQVGNWETRIDPDSQYGYFEHEHTGSGGGLWFEGGELIDYDGVACLPKQVIEAIRSFGHTVSVDFE